MIHYIKMISKKPLWFCMLIFIVSLTFSAANAESNATIYGYVIDKDTGKPFNDITIELFSSSDHSTPVAVLSTDEKGFYNTTVPAGISYDIYVRLSKVNPSRTVYVGEGHVQRVDFEISMQSIGKKDIIEESGFSIVVVVAFAILAIILLDQMRLRRKRAIYEAEISEDATKKNQGEAKTKPEDDIDALKKEKERIENLVALTKKKYHKRKIDDESFREMIRDYQKRLIEIEEKMNEKK